MNQALVLCDKFGQKPTSLNGIQFLELNTRGKKPNVRFEIGVLSAKLKSDLPARVDDLLHIAAYVFAADNRLYRGSSTEVFAESWSRDIQLSIPVFDRDFWSRGSVKEKLQNTLEFLTEDRFKFEFGKRAEKNSQFLKFGDVPQSPLSPDLIIPFSGGLDSLAATIEAIGQGRRPLLVSHVPVSTIHTRQGNLAGLLRERFKTWQFPHATLWVNRASGQRPRDYSQRSRSFLFTALAVAMAKLYSISEIRLCDNGVVSFNLPRSGQNLGAFLSRSTHPRYIELVSDLISSVVGDAELSINNTLLFKTKKEVVEMISSSGHPELIQEAISCAHTEGQTKFQPHCGTCTQCIDRRFATESAGLSKHDLPSRYEKDIFTNALKDGDDRTHAENYVRFAHKLEQISNPEQLVEAYPELYDCLPQNDSAAFLQSGHELFQRHHILVNRLVEKKLSEHAADIRKAVLPENSLLRMVLDGVHTVDPRIRYVHRLRSIIASSLPAAFQSVKAKNEKQVQDVGEAVFLAAKERLAREAPQLPFGTVTTKPDFSDKGTKLQNPLFVEFKYPKARSRLNAVHTEMSSRILIYGAQGAWVLFLVYDPSRTIADDAKFQSAFEQQGVWVGIVR